MGIFRRHAMVVGLAVLCLVGSATAAATQPPAAMSGETLAVAKSVVLKGETTRIPLATGAELAAVRRKLADMVGRSAVYLVLDDLKAAEVPSVVYEIYLGLPAGAAPKPDDPYYVGTLNFFAVAPPNTARRSRSYDVTPIVTRLAQAPPAEFAVTLVATPQGAAAAAAPSIGSVALVAQ
jgi:hypothetical protein